MLHMLQIQPICSPLFGEIGPSPLLGDGVSLQAFYVCELVLQSPTQLLHSSRSRGVALSLLHQSLQS